MNNKPTLFVDSIVNSENGSENQNIFDSRRNYKGKVFHRLDDIISFKLIGRRVWINLTVSGQIIYGEVYMIETNFIHIKKEDYVVTVAIKDILEIRITSIL